MREVSGTASDVEKTSEKSQKRWKRGSRKPYFDFFKKYAAKTDRKHYVQGQLNLRDEKQRCDVLDELEQAVRKHFSLPSGQVSKGKLKDVILGT